MIKGNLHWYSDMTVLVAVLVQHILTVIQDSHFAITYQVGEEVPCQVVFAGGIIGYGVQTRHHYITVVINLNLNQFRIEVITLHESHGHFCFLELGQSQIGGESNLDGSNYHYLYLCRSLGILCASNEQCVCTCLQGNTFSSVQTLGISIGLGCNGVCKRKCIHDRQHLYLSAQLLHERLTYIYSDALGSLNLVDGNSNLGLPFWILVRLNC